MSIKISVYMQDGRVFSYDVASSAKAREHAHRIVTTGYRYLEEETDREVYVPVHQILKVVIMGRAKDAYVEYPAVTAEIE